MNLKAFCFVVQPREAKYCIQPKMVQEGQRSPSVTNPIVTITLGRKIGEPHEHGLLAYSLGKMISECSKDRNGRTQTKPLLEDKVHDTGFGNDSSHVMLKAQTRRGKKKEVHWTTSKVKTGSSRRGSVVNESDYQP